MVRLLLMSTGMYAMMSSSFNPTMVRLLLYYEDLADRYELVSIPQWCDCCPKLKLSSSCEKPSFNPTMVRLLLNLRQPRFVVAVAFQSHNGAIAAVEIKSNKGAVV